MASLVYGVETNNQSDQPTSITSSPTTSSPHPASSLLTTTKSERLSVHVATTQAKLAKEKRAPPADYLDNWEASPNYVGLGHMSNSPVSNWSSRLRAFSPSPKSTRKMLTTPTTISGNLLNYRGSRNTQQQQQQQQQSRLADASTSSSSNQKSTKRGSKSKKTNSNRSKSMNETNRSRTAAPVVPPRRSQKADLKREESCPIKNWSREIDQLASKLENTMTSRQPGKLRRFYLSVFKQFRQLEQQNVVLQSTVKHQDKEMECLRKELEAEKSKVLLLEMDIQNVNTAAVSLAKCLNPQITPPTSSLPPTPRDMLLHGINSNMRSSPSSTSLISSTSTSTSTSTSLLFLDPSINLSPSSPLSSKANGVRQGLLEVFVRFDVDNDGVISCDELNQLRVALKSPAPPLTPIAFERMCITHCLERADATLLNNNGVSRHVSRQGGLTLNGFLAMYELTPRAAVMDLEMLGITLGPLLYPRQALTEATRRLEEGKEHLLRRERKIITLEKDMATLTTRLHMTEQKLMAALNESRVTRQELAKYAQDQKYMHTQLMNEKMRVEAMTQREDTLCIDIKTLKGALVEMKRLLHLKNEEKEHYERQCWAAQEESNLANAMTRAAKAREERATQEKVKLTHQNNTLHTTLKTKQLRYGRTEVECQTESQQPQQSMIHFSRRTTTKV